MKKWKWVRLLSLYIPSVFLIFYTGKTYGYIFQNKMVFDLPTIFLVLGAIVLQIAAVFFYGIHLNPKDFKDRILFLLAIFSLLAMLFAFTSIYSMEKSMAEIGLKKGLIDRK